MAAAQRAAATDGPDPDPGPDPAATCATARWPLPVYFIFKYMDLLCLFWHYFGVISGYFGIVFAF